jgi:hypothetical protein
MYRKTVIMIFERKSIRMNVMLKVVGDIFMEAMKMEKTDYSSSI